MDDLTRLAFHDELSPTEKSALGYFERSNLSFVEIFVAVLAGLTITAFIIYLPLAI